MVKYISWGVIVLIIVALVAWRLGYFEAPISKTEDRKVVIDRLPVSVKVLSPEKVQKKIKASGSILADESVALSTEVAGIVTDIYFKEGEQVQKGEMLLKLNNTDLKAELNKIRKEIDLAELQEERNKKLLEREAVSQSDYDQSRTQLLTLKADSALIQARIQKTEIKAPFSGKIGLRNVSPGAYINAGTSVASVVKDNPLKIEFAVSGRYASELEVGQEILFDVSDNPVQRKAEIYAINPMIDESTRTIAVRALYDNSTDSLRPGSFANVEVVLQKKDQALQVPTQSLALELGTEKIYVIKNGVSTAKTVQTGIRGSNEIEIVKGASVGDSVITSGVVQLREGLPVKAVSKYKAL